VITKRTRSHMQPPVSGSNDGVLACSPDALIVGRTMQGISRARNGFACGRNTTHTSPAASPTRSSAQPLS
jgi:hypothetical protein